MATGRFRPVVTPAEEHPPVPTRFVRYSDDVEVIGPDEDRIAEEIIATMRGESEVLLGLSGIPCTDGRLNLSRPWPW